MTPNERLSPDDRNALLSSILKFFFPGNWRITRSMHIIDAACLSARILNVWPPKRRRERKFTSYRTRCPSVSKHHYYVQFMHVGYLPMPLTAVIIHPRVSLSNTMLRSVWSFSGVCLCAKLFLNTALLCVTNAIYLASAKMIDIRERHV